MCLPGQGRGRLELCFARQHIRSIMRIVLGGKTMAIATARAANSNATETVGQSPSGQIPRDYNFAADVLQSNLDAGRANKPAFIDARGVTTYGQLADRVARFAAGLRGLGIKRE